LPLPIFGRCIAGIAEAIQIRLRERDDIKHLRTTVVQLTHALSALGQVAADVSDPAGAGGPPGGRTDVVMMPPGLLNRTARYLEAAASLVNKGVLPEAFNAANADQLAATFMQDAASLRYYVGE